MTDYKKKIDSIVEETLLQKTFSLEIVNRIRDLKQDLENIQNELENRTKELQEKRLAYQELDKQFEVITKDLTDAKTQIEKWRQREKDILSRELKQDLSEMNTRLIETQNSRHEIKELVSLIFKNPITVKQTTRQEAGDPPAPQYPGQITYPSISTLTDTERISIE